MEGTSQPATPLGPGGGHDEALELGATLREMRLALKRDLDDVADELRIRAAYLRAIEEGRFSDLPGTTYALGFVRAYADALGLDAEDAARRFKAATGGGTPQPNLVLPAPVPSGGLPTGAVLLAAATLAVLAYGGWYVLSTQGKDPGAMVAALPGQIASAVRDVLPARQAQEPPVSATESASPPPSAAATAPAPTPGETAPTADAQMSAPATDGQATVPAAEAPSTLAPSVGETTSAEQAQQAETTQSPAEDEDGPPPPPEPIANASSPPPAADAQPPPAQPKPPQQAALLPPPPTPSAAEPKPPEPAPQAALTPPPPPPPPAPAPVAVSAPIAPAASSASHRIVLVARADSWVELRGPSGAPIYSRVLRKDERYEVPDISGLTMMTGNAGGLEVLVDGTATPSLGAMGAVKRNIAMDADKLRAGTAVPPAPQAATPAPAPAQ